MSDTALNKFIAYGTDAERLAFTPSPATLAAAPFQLYLWYATDTTKFWGYDTTWHDLSAAAQSTKIRVATTANITIATALNNADTLDGISLVTGDYVLVKDQTAPAENGIYIVGAVPARAGDYDVYNEFPGSYFSISEGTANADTLWLCTSDKGGTIGVTALTFTKTSILTTGSVTNAFLADMAALTVKVRAANSSGVPSDIALTDGHTAKRVGTAIVSGPFGPVSVTVINPGTVTYTVPAGVYRIRGRGVGPGGGGGGGDQGAGTSGVGAGGSSGGYFEKTYSVVPAQAFTVAVGTGGAGGLAGNNAGSNGSAATVFDSGGTPITGNAGSGGGSMAAGSSLAGSTGGAVATATGGDVNISGSRGKDGVRYSATVLIGGDGGGTPLAPPSFTTSSGAGTAGVGYGSGGSGSVALASSSDSAGGAGANGVIIVEEFN